MSILQRQHIRFSLDIPALRCPAFGEKIETSLPQISIGGCLLDWDENIYTGEEFRLEIQLPNRNRLPLKCKVLYRSENNGIGVKFVEITKFEQELVSTIITHSLANSGLPLQVDPFALPKTFDTPPPPTLPDFFNPRRETDEILQQIMSSDEEIYS